MVVYGGDAFSGLLLRRSNIGHKFNSAHQNIFSVMFIYSIALCWTADVRRQTDVPITSKYLSIHKNLDVSHMDYLYYAIHKLLNYTRLPFKFSCIVVLLFKIVERRSRCGIHNARIKI